MKNLLSISLIIIYLFGNTEFGQVFNIPQLLGHYQFHKSSNHQLSVLQFLVMHYCTDDGIATDDEQDGKLPFKQVHQFSFIFFTPPEEQKPVQSNFNTVRQETNNFFASGDITPVYLNAPLQPPRFS